MRFQFQNRTIITVFDERESIPNVQMKMTSGFQNQDPNFFRHIYFPLNTSIFSGYWMPSEMNFDPVNTLGYVGIFYDLVKFPNWMTWNLESQIVKNNQKSAKNDQKSFKSHLKSSKNHQKSSKFITNISPNRWSHGTQPALNCFEALKRSRWALGSRTAPKWAKDQPPRHIGEHGDFFIVLRNALWVLYIVVI